MTAELLDKLTDELAASVAAKAGPKLLEWLDARRSMPAADPLLTIPQAALRLGVGATSVRKLVELETLKRAPGFDEIRIRQSVVDAYGK